MANVGVNTNNPGNILGGIGTPSWQGVTGTYVSSNGLTYDQFDTASDGFRALAIDLKNAIAEGYNTIPALVAHYLGTSTPNSQNASPSNYVATVEKVTGLNGTQTLTTSNVASLVQGFSTSEGTWGSLQSGYQAGIASAGLTANADSTGLIANAGGLGNSLEQAASGAFNMLTNPLSGLLGNVVPAAASAASTAGILPPSVTGLFTNLTSGTFITRIALVVIGFILVAAAIFALAKIQPSDVAKVAALA